MERPAVTAPASGPPDPMTMLRSPSYVALLVLAAVLGIPASAAAYGFLKLTALLQKWIFTDLPDWLGFDGAPRWWPLPVLAVGGVVVGLVIQHLPGKGGESPADGFKSGGSPPTPREIPGVALAALATLAFGVVLGPEAPLIALGAGLGAWSIRLARGDPPAAAGAVMAAAGSFAGISTLLGSPILGAFLLMEASGLGGPTLGLVLVPGLLAAGVGSLVFVGLDSWTGYGTFSLAVPGLPPFDRPDVAEFGWAIVIGIVASLLGVGIRRFALSLRPLIERRTPYLTPVVGLAIGAVTVVYTVGTDKGASDVLFSGQSQLGPLLSDSGTYTVATLLVLVSCKGLAYGLSLSSFRGGPVFPALYLGAAGGIAMSHLPGLSLVPAVAMGIGAMSVAMLRLPMTSVLLATLLLSSDGVAVTPLVIVAVVVAYVATARLAPAPVPPAAAGA